MCAGDRVQYEDKKHWRGMNQRCIVLYQQVFNLAVLLLQKTHVRQP